MSELRLIDHKDNVYEVYIHESSYVSVSVYVLQKMQWNWNVYETNFNLSL